MFTQVCIKETGTTNSNAKRRRIQGHAAVVVATCCTYLAWASALLLVWKYDRTGILRAPGEVAGYLRNGSLNFVIWLVGGIYALLCSSSVTKFGCMLSRAGGMVRLLASSFRGRSEHNFRTWQGRLPQELRLAGIGSVEAASRFLRECYVAEFNRPFQVAAALGEAPSALPKVQSGSGVCAAV
jgi:hypothetical protein